MRDLTVTSRLYLHYTQEYAEAPSSPREHTAYAGDRDAPYLADEQEEQQRNLGLDAQD